MGKLLSAPSHHAIRAAFKGGGGLRVPGAASKIPGAGGESPVRRPRRVHRAPTGAILEALSRTVVLRLFELHGDDWFPTQRIRESAGSFNLYFLRPKLLYVYPTTKACKNTDSPYPTSPSASTCPCLTKV